ncbi:hypothetical protein [Mucilaginibacter myungsuensis]|uniref:LPP20 lipoprotein n=1 Tax=Mucilaginibacter myungsuensis TaxID=649104 RepID=A0A929KW00_9SPHI|nr:hypothetical protein [Mucilaginibacter myungsuensis]MBE9661480.1 hypothetical protein [Mucilaginibacter myungsuensis]MDN3597623.1 hypothetical protein [Mucilaginibacter myungsuensis]
MKTIYSILSTICLVVALSSCSHDVYNNKAFLKDNDLQGKKLAVLPVEVTLTGSQPKNSDWYAEEQSTSLSIQNELEHAYLQYTSSHSPKKHQQQVQMVDANTVNQRLKTRVADLRTTWGMAPDSLGRIAGADLVLRVRMSRMRFMSDAAAKGINAGAFIIDALINTKTNQISTLPRVKASEVNYEISLIDVKTGTVVSSFVNRPDKDNNGNSIRKGNEKMAEQSAVFAVR